MSAGEPWPAILEFVLDTPPPTLYHYTSMDGLLGIVGSGTIWASDTRYLNDRTEATHFRDLLRVRIRERIKALEASERTSFEEILAAIESTQTFDMFVASFSEDGDSLSQWRAYCPAGVGFSIGFDAGALRTGYVRDPAGGTSHFVSGQLSKVRYLPEEIGASLDGLLSSTEQVVLTLLNMFPVPGAETVGKAEAVALMISFTAPIYKHAGFSEEHEWRLVLSKVHQPMPGRKFRPGKSMLVPYVEAEPQSKEGYFIKEVIVGPTPHSGLSKESVEALFQALNHREVTVRESRVPYRHW